MGQTYNTLQTTDTLSDSRGYLNTNFSTIQSTFSGTSAPGSAVEGQAYYKTDTDDVWWYNGTTWYKIFNGDETWGGLLPRDGTSTYSMRGILNMGGYKVENAGAPSAANDLVTLTYAQSTLIDGHYHTGAANDGPKVVVTDLDSTGETAWTMPVADASNAVVMKELDSAATTGTVAVGTSWTDLVSVDVVCVANEPKIVIYGARAYNDNTAGRTPPQYQLLRDASVIQGPVSLSVTSTDEWQEFSMAYKDTAPSGATYTYKTQGQYGAGVGTSNYESRWIVVI